MAKSVLLNNASVDMVRYLKIENYEVFRILVKVTGTISNGGYSNKKSMEVSDEVIEFRLLKLSNYKHVFLKMNQNIMDNLYGDFFNKKTWGNECYSQFLSDGWVLKAHHDSCWTEGFDFVGLLGYDDVNVEVIEMGKYVLTEEKIKEIESRAYPYSDVSDMLLSEMIPVQTMTLDLSSTFGFYESFMKGISLLGLKKSFRIQLTKSEPKWREKDVFVIFDDENNAKLVSSVQKNNNITVFTNDFNQEIFSKYFKGMKINHVSDWFCNYEKHIAWLKDRYFDDGLEVSVIEK